MTCMQNAERVEESVDLAAHLGVAAADVDHQRPAEGRRGSSSHDPAAVLAERCAQARAELEVRFWAVGESCRVDAPYG